MGKSSTARGGSTDRGGRRSSRPRGSLSRDEILDAGLRVVREGDGSDLTMQRIARELSVTPMALYRYFENKEALVEGVLGRFVESAAVTRDSGVVGEDVDWKEWLERTFTATRRALVSTPGVVRLLGTGAFHGPGALSVLNEVLEVLQGAGFSKESSAEAFFALMGLTIGAATVEIAWVSPFEEEGQGDQREHLRQLRLRLQALPRDQFPAIVDIAPQLVKAIPRYPFEQGLERTLSALERELESAR